MYICTYTYVHVHMEGINKCTRTFPRICTYTYVHVPGVRHQKHPGSQNRQNDSQRARIDRFCKRFWQRLQKAPPATIYTQICITIYTQIPCTCVYVHMYMYTWGESTSVHVHLSIAWGTSSKAHWVTKQAKRVTEILKLIGFVIVLDSASKSSKRHCLKISLPTGCAFYS